MNQAIAQWTLAAKVALPAKEENFLINISTSITIMTGNIDIGVVPSGC